MDVNNVNSDNNIDYSPTDGFLCLENSQDIWFLNKTKPFQPCGEKFPNQVTCDDEIHLSHMAIA